MNIDGCYAQTYKYADETTNIIQGSEILKFNKFFAVLLILNFYTQK